MKKVAMIPVLSDSTEIPDKNLLLVDGRPMIFYVVEACLEADVFDEIYINSEQLIFEEIAKMLGVRFYHRRSERGGSTCTMQNKFRQCQRDQCQIWDHFLFDFMEAIPSCHLALVHAASPLLTGNTIKSFMKKLIWEDFDSFFCVEERYAQTLFGETRLNFSMTKPANAEVLLPIRMITKALSGWKTTSFMESYRRNDLKENGSAFSGKVGFYPLNRIESLNGETWDDLKLIESSLNYLRERRVAGNFKFHSGITSIECNLKELIKRDGVVKYEDSKANTLHNNLEEIKAKMGPAPWCYLLAYTSTDQTALICQNPGEGARKHCHVTHDEAWVVLEGTFEWHLSDRVIQAKAGDVVFLPKGTIHSIICTSEKAGIRLAYGARDMEHIYVR